MKFVKLESEELAARLAETVYGLRQPGESATDFLLRYDARNISVALATTAQLAQRRTSQAQREPRMTILARYPVAFSMAAIAICSLIAGLIDGGAI